MGVVAVRRKGKEYTQNQSEKARETTMRGIYGKVLSLEWTRENVTHGESVHEGDDELVL